MIVGGVVGRGVAGQLDGGVRRGVAERDYELEDLICPPPGAGC